jgi:glycosyltransferase involved in cell wall biosynthesis
MTKKVLFIEGNVDGTVGGSYYVLYDIVTHLDQTKYTPIVGFHQDNYLVNELRSKGINTYLFSNPASFTFKNKLLDEILFPLKKLINLFVRFIFPALEYSRFLKQSKIDLVNLNNSITRNHPWMLACLIADVKCMTHEMGINLHFSRLSRYFGKRLVSIVPVSHAVHDYMKKGGAGFSNIEVIHNGIDTERYQSFQSKEELRKLYNINATDRVVGVVGNIKYWKGQETLVRAVKEIKEKYPAIKCLLVGGYSDSDSDYIERLKNIIEELQIHDNIIFTGFQKNAIDYMNIMDIVVHTSVEPEPFGIVALEAMYLSKPYVSTTIGGPTEIVVDKKTGLLVDPGKPEQLACAILALLDHPEIAENYGRAANERLYKHFSLESNLQKLTEIYDRVLS